MPNRAGIRNDPWQNYLTTVDAIVASITATSGIGP
jgi:hypothetical protein